MPGVGVIARTLLEIRRDIAAVRDRDPAAAGVSTLELVATWPGLHALLAHRVAHALRRAGLPVLPRLIASVARSVTGIEIHPAAQIGAGLFIDHGMGVVIGETAGIGADVTLYQGVTLGGTGFATGKRHPTIQDNVTIGAGATLLGPITVGHGSKIGAGSVVIHDVPPHSTVVGNPGHPVRVEGRRPEGPDADWVHLPDPIADAIKGLAGRISALEQRHAVAGHHGSEPDGGEGEPRRDEAGGDGGGEGTPLDSAATTSRSFGPNPAGG
jgi:serine O-acetyltransferase